MLQRQNIPFFGLLSDSGRQLHFEQDPWHCTSQKFEKRPNLAIVFSSEEYRFVNCACHISLLLFIPFYSLHFLLLQRSGYLILSVVLITFVIIFSFSSIILILAQSSTETLILSFSLPKHTSSWLFDIISYLYSSRLQLGTYVVSFTLICLFVSCNCTRQYQLTQLYFISYYSKPSATVIHLV